MRRARVVAALKAAAVVALAWLAVPAIVAGLMGAGWLYERHGGAIHVGLFFATVGGFSAAAAGAFYCMFRRGGGNAG